MQTIYATAAYQPLSPGSSIVRQKGIYVDPEELHYRIEYFEDYSKLSADHVAPLFLKEVLALPVGAVILVRSSKVPLYGDHFAVIKEGRHMTERGERPKVHVISAPHTDRILSLYSSYDGAIALLLNVEYTQKFHEFHNLIEEPKSIGISY